MKNYDIGIIGIDVSYLQNFMEIGTLFKKLNWVISNHNQRVFCFIKEEK